MSNIRTTRHKLEEVEDRRSTQEVKIHLSLKILSGGVVPETNQGPS